jgi:hypothetical protein
MAEGKAHIYDPVTAPTEEAVAVLMEAYGWTEIEARENLAIMRGESDGDEVERDAVRRS